MSNDYCKININNKSFNIQEGGVGTVFIDHQGVKIVKNGKKSFIPRKLIETIELKNLNLIIHVRENSEWNKNIKKKYPLRHMIGLVKLYEAYSIGIGVIDLKDSELLDQQLKKLNF